MPIAFEIGQNIYDTSSLIFTIKTIMPDSYRGARKIKEEDLAPLKQKIFDYSDLLLPLIVKKTLIYLKKNFIFFSNIMVYLIS